MTARQHLIPTQPQHDVGFGRHVDHDERSKLFPFTAPTPAATDQNVSWPTSATILNQKSLGACFPPGTLIRMADGSERAIEDVRLGEYVVTAEGNTERVVRTLLRDETNELVIVKAWGHSHLRATKDHQILTSRGYVAAADLLAGDEIALPRFCVSETKTAIVVSDHVTAPSHRLPTQRRYKGVVGRKGLAATAAAMPEKIELDHQFGRLIGLFLAEGCCTSGKANLYFAAHEKDTLAAEVVEIMRSFGVDAQLRMRAAGHCCYVSIYSTGWARLLSSLCGDGAGKKRLHADLTAGGTEFLHAVLTGWLDGDGHYRRNSWSGVSISHQLAMGMYDIAQALGLQPTINRSMPSKNRHAATRQPRWEISFPDRSEAAPKRRPHPRSRKDAKYVWRKVRSVQSESYVGGVYDLTVEGDHSYVAEGVGVHNCVGFTGADLLNTKYCAALRTKLHQSRLYDNADGVNFYHLATLADSIPGAYPPTDTGSSGLGLAKALQKLGLIDSYTHVFGFDHFRQAIAFAPVAVGSLWTNTMMRPDPDGLVHVGELTEANIAGGHEYMVRGINYDTQRVRARNHWGRTWGLHGEFDIGFADFTALLAQQGDVTILHPAVT